jgi:hypothetical protein
MVRDLLEDFPSAIHSSEKVARIKVGVCINEIILLAVPVGRDNHLRIKWRQS